MAVVTSANGSGQGGSNVSSPRGVAAPLSFPVSSTLDDDGRASGKANGNGNGMIQFPASYQRKPLPPSPLPTFLNSSTNTTGSSLRSSSQQSNSSTHQEHLRASTASNATSNSSFLQPPSSPVPPQGSPSTTSTSSATGHGAGPSGSSGNKVFSSSSLNVSQASDMDQTAALIRRLYARLEAQGVPGDGWDEGRERSRDGIINRQEAEGGNTLRGNKSLAEMKAAAANGNVLPLGEEQILKRVDRYGFFSSSHPAALSCQHNRLATLSSAPYSLLPSSTRRTSSSSKSSSNMSPSSSSANKLSKLPHRESSASLLTSLSAEDMALEIKRIDKWGEMLVVSSRDFGGNAKSWNLAAGWWDGRKTGDGKYRRFQRRVFKGVPDRWRRAVWGLEMERVAMECRSGKVRSLDSLEKEYENYVELPSAQDIQIDLDVPRTISGHILFHTRYGQGQRALFHVLHAFGIHSDDIGGYCQGMGPIAATLLCYFEPERVYASLVRLFDQYGLRDIFAPGFPGLLEIFYVQERLVELLMPDVHQSFLDHGISTSAYATKWYITLFSNSIPFSTQLRFWDCLLLEGLDFLVIASLSIIWCFKDEFTQPNTSFESILSTLSSYFFVQDDDALMRWIRKTIRRPDLKQKIAEWKVEWKGFVEDGSAPSRVS